MIHPHITDFIVDGAHTMNNNLESVALNANNLYATDGLCHYAEPGTYGYECGLQAKWLGVKKSGFVMGFCDDCKRDVFPSLGVVYWHRIKN